MNEADARELAERSLPVDAPEEGSPQAFHDRPVRHSLIRRASMLWRGSLLSVRLRNISTHGAMIESQQTFEKGAAVEVHLSDGVQVEGEVRWSQDGRIGVKFAEAFDLQRLGQSRSRQTVTVRPDYLASETRADSPWASRQDRLTVKDVRSS
jgi:hypothetical protein